MAKDFRGKRITVFGLGLNQGGVGTVRFLADQGAKEIIVTDIKKKTELQPSLEKLAKYKNITYVLGAHRPEDFTRVDMVVKNPAISWRNEYIQLAQKHGVPVEMDSSLFFEQVKAPIIGITGSKGKTTTASLIAHILETAGLPVVRVGVSQTGVLSQISKVTPKSVVVFELSSWRLSGLKAAKKSPHIAVFTNLHADHLNYYKTMEAYLRDKELIFRFQKSTDTLVANFDNVAVRESVQDAPGQLLWFAQELHEGMAAWVQDDMLFIQTAQAAKVLMPLEGLKLLGSHNIENVLAAALACLAYGLKPKAIRQGIETFSGIPHRLEFVGTRTDVDYYNDSAATIPEAALSALESFDARPIVWLGGGSDKEIPLSSLGREAARRVKKAILFAGGGTDELVATMEAAGAKDKIAIVHSMAEALALAREAALAGDVVLLSPGTASFGIFQNEFDRGDQFRAQALA
ncbi:MAG: UDP-N-acetylmuramoyl-L-alanine--D-glutamate ligase [Candidatus Moraniibacteriota bacterium]